MHYLLPGSILLLGFALIIFFTPLAWRKTEEQKMAFDPLLDNLQSLEARIGLLQDDFSSLKRGIQASPEENPSSLQNNEAGEKPFGLVLAEKNQAIPLEMELYRAVFQAYDAGQTVTEIAKRLGRGKGEIELILNLRR